MNATTTTTTTRAGSAALSPRLQALLAAVLGLFVVAGVGFSHLPALHNAAHDVRHANGFPCH